MALSLSYTVNGERKHLAWYVGRDTTQLKTVAAFANHVKADGAELEHILASFENIPNCKTSKRVLNWFGDDARFIAGNL